MPSPFPGMDPFLEGAEWEDFHTTFNTVIRELLSPRVEPRYLVRVERRVYVEHTTDEDDQLRRIDVAVVQTTAAGSVPTWSTGSATAIAPVECLLRMPEECHETYLVIRDRESMEVVTVVETLSPRNKRPGSDGRREYLAKRDEVVQSPAHFVELDLLRGGHRLPMNSPLPPGDYFALVSRRGRRPRAEVYAWNLRDPLPTIPIPLKPGDPDVWLELQTVFSTVYGRARYDLSLDYHRTLNPPLSEDDRLWLQNRLQELDSATLE